MELPELDVPVHTDDGRLAAVVDGAFFSSLAADTHFYFIRHGRTSGNANLVFQGRLDYPLDGTGLEQARSAAAWLAGKNIDTVVASPLSRASVTAEIVAEACGCGRPQTWPHLAEVDVGMFAGIDRDTAMARHPEIYGEFFSRSWDAVPGAESSSSMYRRAVDSWAGLRGLAAKGARNIVCVTHGGLLQWLFRSTMGNHSWLPLIPMSNCGISRYDIEASAADGPAFVKWGMIDFVAPAIPSR